MIHVLTNAAWFIIANMWFIAVVIIVNVTGEISWFSVTMTVVYGVLAGLTVKKADAAANAARQPTWGRLE